MKKENRGPPFHYDHHYYKILALFHFISILKNSHLREKFKTLTKCSMCHCLDSLAPHQLSLKKEVERKKKHQHQSHSL